MLTSAILGRVASVIVLIACIRYGLKTFQGSQKPNLASWILWTFIGLLFLGEYFYSTDKSNAETIWVLMSYVLAPFIISILALKKNTEFHIGVNEKVSIAGFSLAVFAWILWGPLYGLYITLAADIFASWPTIIGVWRNPKGEDAISWVLGATGNGLNLFAIGVFDKAVVYPIYLFILTLTITILSIRKIK